MDNALLEHLSLENHMKKPEEIMNDMKFKQQKNKIEKDISETGVSGLERFRMERDECNLSYMSTVKLGMVVVIIQMLIFLLASCYARIAK